jgi:hypothetical protein
MHTNKLQFITYGLPEYRRLPQTTADHNSTPVVSPGFLFADSSPPSLHSPCLLKGALENKFKRSMQICFLAHFVSKSKPTKVTFYINLF